MKRKIFKSDTMEIKSVDKEKREVTAIASKEITDRDGDIVRIDGIDIKNYKKNPVILFAHDHWGLPIAKAIKVWKEDNKFLMVKMKFVEADISPMGDTVYKLIQKDYLKSLSIGFRIDWEKAERLEKSNGYDFKSTELFEISIVPVPANPAALVQSKSIKEAMDNKIINNEEYEELNKAIDILNEDKESNDIDPEKQEHSNNKESDTIYDYIWDKIEVKESKSPSLEDELLDILKTE